MQHIYVMNFKYSLILAGAALAACGSLTAYEIGNKEPIVKPAEWKTLSLKDFRCYNKEKVAEAWTEKDGVIELKGRGGDLITKEQYEDYELELEWAISKDSKKVNSGIFIGARETKKAIYTTAIEMQVLTNETFAKSGDLVISGSVYGLFPSKRDWAKPHGEWNKVRIVSKGSKVEMFFNGKEIAKFDIASDEFKAQLAKTKFKAWPEFATFSKGHIGFQDHGDSKGLKLRNIKVRSIK